MAWQNRQTRLRNKCLKVKCLQVELLHGNRVATESPALQKTSRPWGRYQLAAPNVQPNKRREPAQACLWSDKEPGSTRRATSKKAVIVQPYRHFGSRRGGTEACMACQVRCVGRGKGERTHSLGPWGGWHNASTKPPPEMPEVHGAA